MMRNKLVIQTVGNGFVIDFGNNTARPSVDKLTRVARSPEELAEIVADWATTQIVIPAGQTTGFMVLAETDPYRIPKDPAPRHFARLCQEEQ